LRQAFHCASGYGLIEPSFMTSATEMGESSVQRGKLTKIRPVSVTVTPVTWCSNCATCSSVAWGVRLSDGAVQAGAVLSMPASARTIDAGSCFMIFSLLRMRRAWGANDPVCMYQMGLLLVT
jgi:hypothetical protein